jgi:hypothetical protein
MLPLLNKFPVALGAEAMTIDITVGLRQFYETKLRKNLQGYEQGYVEGTSTITLSNTRL